MGYCYSIFTERQNLKQRYDSCITGWLRFGPWGRFFRRVFQSWLFIRLGRAADRCLSVVFPYGIGEFRLYWAGLVPALWEVSQTRRSLIMWRSFKDFLDKRVWDNTTEIPNGDQGISKMNYSPRFVLVHRWRVTKNVDKSFPRNIFANHLWNLPGHVTLYHANGWCFKVTSRPFQRKRWNIRCSVSSIFYKETSLKEIASCSSARRDIFSG